MTAATMTARQIAFRTARRERDANSRATRILTAAYTPVDNTPIIDEKGREVRPTRATYDEVAHFLLNNRVVDTVDILRELGALAFDALIANGYIRKDASYNPKRASNLFWVTKKAQGHYKLPERITLVGGAQVAYA